VASNSSLRTDQLLNNKLFTSFILRHRSAPVKTVIVF